MKWVVGRTYAVQPGSGKPGIVWREDHNGNVMWALPNSEDVATFDDWTPLRIRITGIRQERLRDISEDDVVAEGHNLVRWASEGPEGWPATAEYAEVWDRINTRKGTRWADNPLVWVLDFEVVR